MVFHPTFLLDQMGHAPRGPQAGLVAQRLGPSLQPLLDVPQIFRTQARSPPHMSGFLQRPHAAVLQVCRPTADRLAMRAHLAGHFGLMHSLAQQFCRLQSPLLQLLKISPYSRRISHERRVAHIRKNVTILCNSQ